MTERGANYARRANDDYPTPPETTDVVLKAATWSKTICDPCCGKKKLLNPFAKKGHKVVGGDLIYGFNFLTDTFRWKNVDIITNPPYGPVGQTALAFIMRALEVTEPWSGKVAMLLPVDFDSGKTRVEAFRDCPHFARKIILLNRIKWFDGKAGSTNHAWFIWEHTNHLEPHISYELQEYT